MGTSTPKKEAGRPLLRGEVGRGRGATNDAMLALSQSKHKENVLNCKRHLRPGQGVLNTDT